MVKAIKLIIVLIVILVLFNLLAYLYLNGFELPSSQGSKGVLRIFSTEKDLREDPEVQGCFEAKDERDCLLQLGLRRDDINFCNIVEQDLYKARCFAYFAIARDDPKLCEETTKLSDSTDCFIYLALADKDISQCGRDITNRYSAESCIKAVQQDYSNCDEDETLDEPCFYTAILTDDTNMCYKLSKPDRELCLTILTGDETICESLNIYPENKSIGDILCWTIAKKDTSKCGDIYDCEDIDGLLLFSELGRLRTNYKFS